jgi:hypothetical protein
MFDFFEEPVGGLNLEFLDEEARDPLQKLSAGIFSGYHGLLEVIRPFEVLLLLLKGISRQR